MVCILIGYFDTGQIIINHIPFPLDDTGKGAIADLVNSDELAKLEIIPAQSFANEP
jgi:hypothetical protein